jgi:hypothetical protein
MEFYGNTKIRNDYSSVDNFIKSFINTYRDCYTTKIFTRAEMLELLGLKEEWLIKYNIKITTNFKDTLYITGYPHPLKAKLEGSHYILPISTYINFHKALYLLFVADINDPNLVVDHIDTNPLNNHLENFRLITRKQNYSRNCINSICLEGFKKNNWTIEMFKEMLSKLATWADWGVNDLCNEKELEKITAFLSK